MPELIVQSNARRAYRTKRYVARRNLQQWSGLRQRAVSLRLLAVYPKAVLQALTKPLWKSQHHGRRITIVLQIYERQPCKESQCWNEELLELGHGQATGADGRYQIYPLFVEFVFGPIDVGLVLSPSSSTSPS